MGKEVRRHRAEVVVPKEAIGWIMGYITEEELSKGVDVEEKVGYFRAGLEDLLGDLRSIMGKGEK